MTLLKTVFLPLLLWPVFVAGDGWLGVFMADSESEARIAEVIPGSPADRAGLRGGDVLLEVDGIATGTVEALAAAIQGHDAGDRIRLKVRRGQEEFPVEVQLAARPGEFAEDPVPAPRGRPLLGVGVVEGEGGLVVCQVLADSPAARAGIRSGDRIVRVDGRAVGRFEDLDRVMAELAPGAEIAVNLENDQGAASLLIRLGARPAAPDPGAGPGQSTEDVATPTGPDSDLEGRLSRAELQVERLDREMRTVEELRVMLHELQQLRDELRELRLLLVELLARDR